MSTTYREDCLKAKAAKAGIIEQRPVRGKSGKPRPVVLEFRTIPGHPLGSISGHKNRWLKWKAYRTEAEAQNAAEVQRRKHSTLWEFRIRGADSATERKS